jgi:hypothetical protein
VSREDIDPVCCVKPFALHWSADSRVRRNPGQPLRSSSGSLALFAAIRRASSRVSKFCCCGKSAALAAAPARSRRRRQRRCGLCPTKSCGGPCQLPSGLPGRAQWRGGAAQDCARSMGASTVIDALRLLDRRSMARTQAGRAGRRGKDANRLIGCRRVNAAADRPHSGESRPCPWPSPASPILPNTSLTAAACMTKHLLARKGNA